MSSRQRNSRPDGDLGDPDHLAESRPDDPALARSLALVRHLRLHCPWDGRQTPRTLVPYLLEEADETADAILREDAAALRDELGDLLLNLAFQIVLAEEEGTFGPAEVVARLEEKMRIRHPHVYADAEEPPDWEETKRLDDEPAGAAGEPDRGAASGPRSTALGDAVRTQARAARVGFDWPKAAGALGKVREEADELAEVLSAGREGSRGEPPGDEDGAALREEVGDLLFAAVSVARLADVDPEAALREATGKFRARFRRLLRLAERRGADPMEADLESLEALWREVKEG